MCEKRCGESFVNGICFNKMKFLKLLPSCKSVHLLQMSYLNLAAAAEKGQVDESLELFNQAVAMAPDFPSCYNNRAQALRIKGDIDSRCDRADTFRIMVDIGSRCDRAQALRIKGDIDGMCDMAQALRIKGDIDGRCDGPGSQDLG